MSEFCKINKTTFFTEHLWATAPTFSMLARFLITLPEYATLYYDGHTQKIIMKERYILKNNLPSELIMVSP